MFPEHWHQVIEAVHKYVALLRCLPFDPILYDEYCTTSRNAFQQAPVESPFSHASVLAQNLSKPYNRRDLLAGSWLFRDWDPRLLEDCVNQLTPIRSRVMLMGRDQWHDITLHGSPISMRGEQWCSELCYATQYIVRRFYDSAVPLYCLRDSYSEGFSPPSLNPYMPLNMEIVTKSEVRWPSRNILVEFFMKLAVGVVFSP